MLLSNNQNDSIKDKNTNCPIDPMGGQAVLEGVMMKGKDTYAMAVRKENGEIVIKKGKVKSIKDKIKFLGLPFFRGIVNLVESMLFSFKNITLSTEMAGIEFEEEQTKFEKWLEKKFGKSIINVISVIASILGVLLAVFLFMYLPSLLAQGVEFIITKLPWRGFLPAWGFNIIEGVFKIIIFIVYIALTSKLNDIKRLYQYHGAEHKSIFCLEKGEELTVENVRKQSRFHPRCGTSFIFVILIISIAVMTVATTLINNFSFLGLDISNNLIRTALKLSLLPITVGIGYEFIRFAGKHDNIFTRVLSAPGLWMQRITTKEPDDEMIEVAITSLKAALPHRYPDENQEYEKMLYDESKSVSNDSQKNLSEHGETSETDQISEESQEDKKQDNISSENQ